jgi:hypothetical protein
MSQQSVRHAARRSALNAQAVLRKERADRDRRREALAVAVLTALGERDALVPDAERRAAQARCCGSTAVIRPIETDAMDEWQAESGRRRIPAIAVGPFAGTACRPLGYRRYAVFHRFVRVVPPVVVSDLISQGRFDWTSTRWMSTRQKPLPASCVSFDRQRDLLGLPRIAQGLGRLRSSSLWA